MTRLKLAPSYAGGQVSVSRLSKLLPIKLDRGVPTEPRRTKIAGLSVI